MKYLILLVLFIFLGCGHQKGGDTLLPSLGQNLVQKNEYSPTDLYVATKICYAFMSKRSSFFSNYLNAEFRFVLKRKNTNCQYSEKNEELVTYLRGAGVSEPMFFDAVKIPSGFEKYVQTDSDGYLTDICQRIFDGDELPSPTEISDSSASQIEFINNGGTMLSFFVKEYQRQTEGGDYSLVSYDFLKVLVDKNAEKYGIVFERIKEKECTNGLVEYSSQVYNP